MDDRSARVLRAIEATVSGDTSGVEDLFTRDVTASTPTMKVASRVELAVELEDEDDRACVCPIAIEPGPTIASGDRVCTEWVATGIHSEPDTGADRGPFAESEPRVTLRGVTVAEFDGERIRAVRHYWNEVAVQPDPPAPSGS